MAVVATVGSHEITTAAVSKAAARLGLSRCQALGRLVESELARQGGWDADVSPRPEEIRMEVARLRATSAYLVARARARDSFLWRLAADRLRRKSASEAVATARRKGRVRVLLDECRAVIG